MKNTKAKTLTFLVILATFSLSLFGCKLQNTPAESDYSHFSHSSNSEKSSIDSASQAPIQSSSNNEFFTAEGEGCFNFSNGILTSIKKEYLDAEKIVVPSARKISEGALSGCSKVKQLCIPYIGEQLSSENQTTKKPFCHLFGKNEFSGAKKVTQFFPNGSNFSVDDYYLPSSLEKIFVNGGGLHPGAFSNVRNVVEIEFTHGITEIPQNAFFSCHNLRLVKSSKSITHVGASAFFSCYNLNSVDDMLASVRVIDNFAFARTGITELTLPDTLESLSTSAFSDCKKLVQITNLSKFDVSSPSHMFGEVRKDKLSPFSTVIEKYDDVCVLKKDDTRYLLSTKKQSEHLDLKDINAQEIYPYSLAYLTASKITLPKTLKSISEFAFFDSEYLKEVDLSYCQNLTKIEKAGFSNCSNLKSITFCPSLESIGESAFYYCKNLSNLYFYKNLKQIGIYAFTGCKNLNSITFEKPDGWYKSENKNLSNALSINLNQPSTNLTKTFVESYSNYYLFNK